jgi:transposase
MPRSQLSDHMWERLAPLLPSETGRRGRPSLPNRPFIEAILWKHRTGAPWRDLPESFGPWASVFTRFNRWSRAGVWQTVLEVLRGEADNEWVMLDGTVIRAHQHAAGAKGGPAGRVLEDPGADSPRKST